MSKVSRSTYQKLKEENKKLLRDLYTLTMKAVTFEAIQVKIKWKDKFTKEAEFNEMLIVAAKNYLKEHPEYDLKRELK